MSLRWQTGRVSIVFLFFSFFSPPSARKKGLLGERNHPQLLVVLTYNTMRYWVDAVEVAVELVVDEVVVVAVPVVVASVDAGLEEEVDVLAAAVPGTHWSR